MSSSMGLAELLKGMVVAFGGPTPTSFGLGELLEDLENAIGGHSGAYVPVSQSPINPLNYGCVGDGVTNDTVNFQAAVNAWKATLRAGNQHVAFYLPGGFNFFVTESIDCTGVGYGASNWYGDGGYLASTISGKLTDAYPILDFTGSNGWRGSDFWVAGVAGGLQTCGILNARAASNGAGDNTYHSNLNVGGTFSQVAVANISADLSIYDKPNYNGPSCLFIGDTDVLEVGSKYQAFDATTGNTHHSVRGFIGTASARSGIILSNGDQLLVDGFINLGGTAVQALEAIGNGANSFFGVLKIESTSSAATQSVLTIDGTAGSSHGNIAGDWQLKGSVAASAINFTGAGELSDYRVDAGALTCTGGGTVEVFSGASGSANGCTIVNNLNLALGSITPGNASTVQSSESLTLYSNTSVVNQDSLGNQFYDQLFSGTELTTLYQAVGQAATAILQVLLQGITAGVPNTVRLQLQGTANSYLQAIAALRVQAAAGDTLHLGDANGDLIQLNYANLQALLADGFYFQGGTTSGTRIMVGPNEKLGFWGATAIAQPTASGETSGYTAGSSTAVTIDGKTTGGLGSTAYTLGDIVAALKNAGLIAS